MTEISSTIRRSSAELAILAVLPDRPLHGYEIAKQIERETNGVLTFNFASLYPMLYGLEKRGWLKGTWETKRPRRARRCYRLTTAGKIRVRSLGRQWQAFFQAVDRLMGMVRA